MQRLIRGGRTVAIVLVLGLCQAFPLFSQDPDYILTITDSAGPPGGLSEPVSFLLTNNGDPIPGYQFGACTPIDLTIDAGDIEDGLDLGDLEFTFAAATVVDGGFTLGALLSPITMDTIGIVADFEVLRARYTMPDVEDGIFDVEYCDTLGDPLVVTAVIVDGTDITPTTENGVIEIARLPYLLNLSEETIEYRPEDGLTPDDEVPTALATVSIFDDLTLRPEGEGPGDTQAFSLGLTYDDTALTLLDLVATGPLLDLNMGDGPDFFGVNLSAAPGGATVGCVYAPFADEFITFDTEADVVELTLEGDTAQLLGNVLGQSTALDFSDDLGDPPVRNTVVVGGFSTDVRFDAGSVTFSPIIQVPFIRGDCNQTGDIDISDPIFLLQELFQGNSFDCPPACNFNGVEDAGVLLGVADAIYLFDYLFSGGPAPSAPFPDCGPATQEFEFDLCESFSPCL